VELQGTSVVHGNIVTRRLFVQEGGEINGILRMGADAEQNEARAVAGSISAQSAH
jgi:cytoskeletal protein CcmA (bactofilin family)